MKLQESIKNKLLWFMLATVLVYIVLILVADIDKMYRHFLQIRVELLILIFTLIFLSHVVKSLRQKELLDVLDEKIPFIQHLVIYMAGLSLINTPGGAGTFIKSVFLKDKFNVNTGKSFSVIFLERFHDLLAGTSIIIAGLLIYFNTISVLLVLISSTILCGVYLMIRNKNFSRYVYNKLSKIRFISKYLPDNIGSDVSFFILSKPKNMAKGWLYSVFGWSIDALAVYMIFLALNVNLGYLLTSQIYFTSIGYGVLSFLPGGIGVNESMTEFLLLQQGLEVFVASSLVILTRLSTIWFATFLGVIFTRIAIKQKSVLKK